MAGPSASRHIATNATSMSNDPGNLAGDAHWPPDLPIELKDIGTGPEPRARFSRPLGDRSFDAAVETETGKYLDQACKDQQVEPRPRQGVP